MPESLESQAAPGGEDQATRDHAQDEAQIVKIQELLKTKNDTSQFVGLALLKSVLDNTPKLRDDKVAIARLWEAIPPSFVQRLLRTGSTKKDARDMLDLAVAVLHTFAILLPEDRKGDAALVDRIPLLVASLLTR